MDFLSKACWDAADADARLDAARAIAQRLRGFRVTLEASVPRLLHEASQTTFAIVPGGTFGAGFRPDEVERLRREAGKPGEPGYDSWAPVVERVLGDAPAREVTVAPFLCALAPVLDHQVEAIDPDLVGRCPLEVEEEFPDLDAPFVPDDDESDLEAPEDRALHRPAFLEAHEAETVARTLGLRMLRDEEWEYVAREGGARSWIASAGDSYRDVVRSVAALKDSPVFLPGPLREAASNALGLWALHVGEWVAGAASSRGGAVLGWPWQDSTEIVFAHPAVRRAGAPFGKHAAMRLALDLP